MKARIISLLLLVIIMFTLGSCYVIVREKKHPRHAHVVVTKADSQQQDGTSKTTNDPEKSESTSHTK